MTIKEMVLDQLDRAYANYYEMYNQLKELGLYEFAKVYKDLTVVVNIHRDNLRGQK